MTPIQTDALVTEVAAESPYQLVRLQAPALATRVQPGQFVTADPSSLRASLGGALRHPLLPATVRAEGLDLLLPPAHPAAALAAGQRVNLLGPLGKPLRLPHPPARLLLVADGQHLPALLPAAHRALANGCPVALLLSVPTAAALYPPSRLPPALEIHLVTADGSAGHDGSLLDLLTGSGEAPLLLTWADRILLATDPVLYPALAEATRAARLSPSPDFAQALLLPTIVCGVGACRGCAVPTRRGYRRACTDGPFFDLLEVEAE